METTEKDEEKASEILARAAKLLNDAPKVYDANLELMREQDALQQDLLHKLEIENLTRDERATVSYTHLDVYKRQVLLCSCEARIRNF